MRYMKEKIQDVYFPQDTPKDVPPPPPQAALFVLMLKTIAKSANRKLGGCAATYRSGASDVYGSCPATCSMMPPQNTGSQFVDQEYLEAVKAGTPQGGWAWTYTHFSSIDAPGFTRTPEPGSTCINFSYEDPALLSGYVHRTGNYRAVIVRPADEDSKVDHYGGIRAVRCPAEYLDQVTCNNCGGEKGPLCARADRDYVIKFTAHGAGAKVISIREAFAPSPETGANPPRGGCYGSGGPVRLQWEKTRASSSTLSDADQLREFVRSLPPGTRLRHHVVGDLGQIR
jgi:hypothetical protein